ncbi:MAG: hypothetical protein IJN72_10460 [Firmicutes bacterium]|nr:hypothetical protein [Bacillota bacterium]
MKKILVLLLALMMIFCFSACGTDEPADDPVQQQQEQQPDGQEADEQQQEQQPPADIPEELEGYLATKTGKFYSQFAGKMYMEYEMEMEGQKLTMITATSGDKSYSETIIGGVSTGVSIIDGETMYVIDHASKMVIKMGLQADVQTIAGTIVEESDVNMGELKEGTRKIDGKTYETEEWIIDGGASIMCFDGDDLVYMIGAFEGEEAVMKIIEASDKVDEKLFEIPDNYQMMEM